MEKMITIIHTENPILLSNSCYKFYELGTRLVYSKSEASGDPEEIKTLLDKHNMQYSIQLSLF